MTASEKLMRKKKVYKAELDKATPMSGELWERATVRLGEIRTKYGTLPKGIRAHTDKIFPAAAVYLTVKEELGEKTAYSVLENASVKLCAEIAPKLARLMKLPGMRGLFVKLWDPMTRKMFGRRTTFGTCSTPRKRMSTGWT